MIKSIVHFMAYPGPGNTDVTLKGEAPEAYLLRTIKNILDDPYFGGIEITHIKDPAIRAKATEMLRSSGYVVTYSAQPVQLINEDNLIAESDISSTDFIERHKAVTRIIECLEEAVELGASNIAVLSGRDPVPDGADVAFTQRLRKDALNALALSLDEICKAAASYESIKPTGINVILEVFDRKQGKNLKNCLVGPAEDAYYIAETVRKVYENNNFGLLYDLSHMVLMEESPDVLLKLAPYLSFIHIANCILTPDSPTDLYGDQHPAFGIPGSGVDEELLASFLRNLNEIGYKGPIGFEVRPRRDEIPESLVGSTKAFFDQARNRIDVKYVIGAYAFKTRRFAPERFFERLTELRIQQKKLVAEEADLRRKREVLTEDGKLVILAADHPARYVTRVGEDPVAMGDRQEYLGRILRVMLNGQIDGLMATADIIDDVLLMNRIWKENGNESFLDDKLLIGSMNRGGLSGAIYEMDDRMTGYRSAERLTAMNLDGAKMMLRLAVPDTYDRYSIQTLEYCARAIEECNRFNLPVFLEALPVQKIGNNYRTVMNIHDLIKVVGVASALSESSINLWLKIPYIEGYDQVAKATTLPILMLGGEATGNPTKTIEEFERGLGSAPNVRGALIGRNVLYPGMDDPYAVAAAIYRLVHENLRTDEAISYLVSRRGMGKSFEKVKSK